MKKYVYSTLALAVALFLALACTPAPQPETPEETPEVTPDPEPEDEGGCTITGKVRNALGKSLVKGITVEIGEHSTVTDENGTYKIEHYPIDSDDLTVKLHLEDRVAEYELLPGELTELGTVSLPDFFSGYDIRDGVKVQKVGELWQLIPNEIRVNEVGTIQGLAIDGDNIFFFHDKGGYSCFSLSRMRHLYSGDTDPEDTYGLHCNEAFFGPEKLTPESEHPLLFVSACIPPYNIYVYDISSKGSQLVGTLNPPEDVGEHIEWMYGISAYSYDAENGWLYGHNTDFIRRYRFPSFSEFTEGSYTMKKDDFLGEMIFSPALTLPQGACARDGKLYMPSGVYSSARCCLYVYDFAKGDLKIIDINDFCLEPEGIDYKDGWFYVAFNRSSKEVLYRFQF
ncbi:MAG: carboxypeptidase-like regulatory domain-containing protein [Bacteroidales bacterium]|nr:carboxypeptidase-like regulatory domain-containing protein [Bacteroidales bacterium]